MRNDQHQSDTTASAIAATQGRLRSRPTPPMEPAPTATIQRLGIAPDRDALLFAPAAYTPREPVPLIVMLHGANGSAEHGMSMAQQLAGDGAALLLAPASQQPTWDVITRSYGADVRVIDRALEHVFRRYAVDAGRLAIGGFSDGASYALSLGLINGDLFSHIIALSPGFMAPTSATGQPRIFVSHGTRDAVLPIDRCSHRIVPRLRSAGYDVTYHEFEGGHTIPPKVILDVGRWFTLS